MSVPECIVIIELIQTSQNMDRLDSVKHLWASPPLPIKKIIYSYADPIIRHTLVLEHGPYDAEGDDYVCKLLGCDPGELLDTWNVTDEVFFVNYPSAENL